MFLLSECLSVRQLSVCQSVTLASHAYTRFKILKYSSHYVTDECFFNINFAILNLELHLERVN